MSKIAIALHGLPRVGKDTLARLLVSEIPWSMQFSFADELYQDLEEMFGVEIERLQSADWKTQPQDALACIRCADPDYRQFLTSRGVHGVDAQTSRFHLQTYGTDYRQGRDGADYWSKRLRLQLDAVEAGAEVDTVPIISDLRRYGDSFHELDMLRAYAKAYDRRLFVVQVERPGVDSSDEHRSNQSYPQSAIDATVVNDGDPQDMLRSTMTQLREKLQA